MYCIDVFPAIHKDKARKCIWGTENPDGLTERNLRGDKVTSPSPHCQG